MKKKISDMLSEKFEASKKKTEKKNGQPRSLRDRFLNSPHAVLMGIKTIDELLEDHTK